MAICGGDDGLLKIVRLDVNSNHGNLTVSNQTLEGHYECVSIVVWNSTSQKPTTSDQNGLITVWVFFKGN